MKVTYNFAGYNTHKVVAAYITNWQQENKPGMVAYMIDKLDAACGLVLRKPKLHNTPKIVQGETFD